MRTRIMPTHFRLLNDLSQALHLGMSIDDAHERRCNTPFLAREMQAREDGTPRRVVPVVVKLSLHDKLGELSIFDALKSEAHRSQTMNLAIEILAAMVQEGAQYGVLYGADGLVAVKRTTQAADKTLSFSKKFKHDGVSPTLQVPLTPRYRVWVERATQRATWFIRTLQGAMSQERNPSSRRPSGQRRSQQTADDGPGDEDLDALQAKSRLLSVEWREILALPDTRWGCKLLLRALPEASYADLQLQQQISGRAATQVWRSELNGRQTITKAFNFGRDQSVLSHMVAEIAAAAFLPEDVRPSLLAVGVTLQTLAFLVFQYKGQELDQAGLALYAEQIRTKLASAHDAGLVHGDVALRNLVALNGQVSIVDWGNCSFTHDQADQQADWEDLRILLQA